MDYFVLREDFKGLTHLLDEAPQYIDVSLQSLEEVLVMHMIDTLSLEEFSLDIVELLAQAVGSYLIDQPVILGLINIINKLGNVLDARELLRIYSVAYLTIWLSREQ
jgi:hypothetical protein